MVIFNKIVRLSSNIMLKYRIQRILSEQLQSPALPLKLHLGCGHQRLEGFINIDLNRTSATDIVTDISRLPFPDESVDAIESYHVFEHLPFPKTEIYLKEWHRILKPGGTLTMELPDFDQNVSDYISGNSESLYSIFGRQRFPGDAHHWGYNESRLQLILESNHFKKVSFETPQDYHALKEPCLRVRAER